MLFLETVAKPLHFLHLVAAVTSLASCVHLLVRLWGKGRDKRIRTHALVLGIAYLSTYALGALIYPTFRVRVRAALLDPVYPWATGLFEIKEHAATLMLAPVLAIFLLARGLDATAALDRRHSLLVGGLTSIVLTVLIYNACVGWYLGTLRSI